MTSSGTYSFSLSNANIVEQAFGRLTIRRTALLAEHLRDGWRELNLALVKFDNLQPNLWKSADETVALIDGTATYDMLPRDVNILSCFIRTGTGTGQNDRTIYPVSTTEYTSYPNKNITGFPTVFWFDRQITPQITFWPVPDQTSYYTAYLKVVRQVQDANLPGGETPDVPVRFYDALIAETAYRLSRYWKPELEMARKQDAMDAWTIAATQDVENVNLTITPMVGVYYGR
jgi:hypothetical protein